MIIRNDFQQRSAEWHKARCGIPTASGFDRILTPTLKPSAQASGYIAELVGDWWLGAPPEDEWGGSYWTERGEELEGEARKWFEFHADLTVEDVGLVYRDEDCMVACSPDGLVYRDGELVAGLEMKCPKRATHVQYLLEGGVPRQYQLQVQGSLWVTELPCWWFLSYYPGLPPALCQVWPESATQAALSEAVPDFLERMMAARQKLQEAAA